MGNCIISKNLAHTFWIIFPNGQTVLLFPHKHMRRIALLLALFIFSTVAYFAFSLVVCLH